MKTLVSALALLAGLAAVAPAQGLPQIPQPAAGQTKVGLRTYVGTFAPVLPLVAAPASLTYASVELESGSIAGFEFDYALKSSLRAYFGLAHARSRVNHSSLMLLQGPYRDESPVGLFAPTLGVIFAPQIGVRDVRPTLRLGAGVKFYDFDLIEVKNGVQDPTADIGIGVMAGTHPVAFTAEMRWLLSQFDPAYLPVRVIGTKKQLQDDLVLQLGMRFGL